MLRKLLEFIFPILKKKSPPVIWETKEDDSRESPPSLPPVTLSGYALPTAILTGVNPRLLVIAKEIINELRKEGYQAVIHNAMRTPEQAAKNAAAGVGIKNSKHITGQAVDIIDKRYAWNEQHINHIKAFRASYGSLASQYPEIIWGGTWTKGKYGALGDWAHIELK